MPHHSTTDAVNTALVAFLVLLEPGEALRALQDAPTAAPSMDGTIDDVPCGEALVDIDIFGGDITGTFTTTTSLDDCVTVCENTPTCEAVSYLGTHCFPKDLPDFFVITDRAGSTIFRLCPDEDTATTPADTPIQEETGAETPTPTAAADPTPAPTLAPTPVDAPSPTTGDVASTGQWGPVIDFPVIPVASAALPSGNVLVWSGAEVDNYSGGNGGDTFYALFDPSSDSVGSLQVVNNAHDMFCPGIAMLTNGDVFVAAGSAGGDGASASSTWTGSSFVAGPSLNIARGYNSALTLASGDVFTLGGSFSGVQSIDKGGEVYSPTANTWTLTADIQAASILSDDPQGVFRTDNYGFFFAWSGNSVFHGGPSTQMNWFTDLEGDGVTTSAGTRGPTAMNGNAVMYEAGKILTVGGAPSYSQGDDARTGAEIITLGAVGAEPTVESISGPNVPRTYAMAVVLPTGEVAHIGGAETAVEFSDATAILQTEIWNPTTQTFTLDASSAVPRTYHSSAVLMPDGRVFVGGGGLCGECGVNHLDAEMYSPAYLFNADGTAAARPTVSLGVTSAGPGDLISVTGTETLSMVSMIRYSGSTHGTNTDQRRLELCGPSTDACAGASPMVSIPGTGIATPGYWMVFGINAAGVPGVAATLIIN